MLFFLFETNRNKLSTKEITNKLLQDGFSLFFKRFLKAYHISINQKEKDQKEEEIIIFMYPKIKTQLIFPGCTSL